MSPLLQQDGDCMNTKKLTSKVNLFLRYIVIHRQFPLLVVEIRTVICGKFHALNLTRKIYDKTAKQTRIFSGG